MRAKEVFEIWAQLFTADPKTWARFAGRYRWVVSGVDGGMWTMECGVRPSVTPNCAETADFELRISVEDFLAMLRLELNPQIAFLERRMNVIGKTKYVLRFNLLLEQLLQLKRVYGIADSQASLS